MKPGGRAAVLALDGGLCHYQCGNPADTMDHIVPKSAGGPSCRWNLVGACKKCNGKKGNDRKVCICVRCIEAERLFAGYTRPSNIPRRQRKSKPSPVSWSERWASKPTASASQACPISMDKQHVPADDGRVTVYCARCYEVLAA